MKFGKKLKTILEIRDIRQKDFAAAINVAPSTLSGYINSGKQPDFELVKEMASVLDVSTDYLLDYNNKTTEQPLSVKELSMLARLRSLDKERQETVFRLVELLSENNGKN